MMEWTPLYLLWISLVSVSAHNYQGTGYSFFDYSQSDDSERSIETRKINSSNTKPLALIREPDQEVRTNRRSQRPNERSLPVSSSIQQVQENERKRFQPRIEDVPRSENGSYKIVNNFPLLPSISSRRGEAQDRIGDSVVFPGPTTANDYVPEIPDDCKAIGICETIPNYPHEIVQNILAKLGKNKELLFHLDKLDEPQIAQRIGPGDSDGIDLELCNSREDIIKPEAAKDVKGDWYVILNQKDQPIQGYRIEICRNEGRSCADNIATFHTGYSAYCKQKYVQRTMTAVDVNKQTIIYDLPFKIPSCCACVGKQSGRR